MRKILVSGGAGFIGSHVADALIADGHEVTIIDNLSTGRIFNVPAQASFIEMDITDNRVADLWAENTFDTLIHLAAQIDVRKSVANPVDNARINTLGTLNLLENGRKNGLKKVVFISTGGAAFNDDVEFPTPESTPAIPLSPYGITKIEGEAYLKYFKSEYDLDYVALRLANVYGPRQNPLGEAGVVSIFTTRMLTDVKAVVNGDGLQTRDYIYVGDVVSGVQAALKVEKSGTFHVGTGVETNVVELFEIVRSAIQSEMPVEHGPSMGGEVRRSCLDATLFNATTGWKPLHDMEKGIGLTVEFFKRQLTDPEAR